MTHFDSDWADRLQKQCAGLNGFRVRMHALLAQISERSTLLFDAGGEEGGLKRTAGLRAFWFERFRQAGATDLAKFLRSDPESRDFVETSGFGWVGPEELTSLAVAAWVCSAAVLRKSKSRVAERLVELIAAPILPARLGEGVFAHAANAGELVDGDVPAFFRDLRARLAPLFSRHIYVRRHAGWIERQWIRPSPPPRRSRPGWLSRLWLWLRRVILRQAPRPEPEPEPAPGFLAFGVTFEYLPASETLRSGLHACHDLRLREASELRGDIASWDSMLAAEAAALDRLREAADPYLSPPVRQIPLVESEQRTRTATDLVKELADAVSKARALPARASTP